MKLKNVFALCITLAVVFCIGVSTVFAEDDLQYLGIHLEPTENAIVIINDDYIDVGIVTNNFEPFAQQQAIDSSSMIFDNDILYSMSYYEIIEYLKENTSFSNETIILAADAVINQRDSLGISSHYIPITPLSGWGHMHLRWITPPYRVGTPERWVRFSTSWIGIDNFRSSNTFTVGETVSSTISRVIGFTGEARIRTHGTLGLTASRTTSQTATLQRGATANPWTTVNWRPYIAFYIDNIRGVEEVFLVHPSTGMIGGVDVVTVTGQYARVRVSTNEVWTRVNTNQLQNLPTPLPPTTQPSITW